MLIREMTFVFHKSEQALTKGDFKRNCQRRFIKHSTDASFYSNERFHGVVVTAASSVRIHDGIFDTTPFSSESFVVSACLLFHTISTMQSRDKSKNFRSPYLPHPYISAIFHSTFLEGHDKSKTLKNIIEFVVEELRKREKKCIGSHSFLLCYRRLYLFQRSLSSHVFRLLPIIYQKPTLDFLSIFSKVNTS